MASVLSNDLRKGDVVRMRGTGWKATIADNKKGNIRMATVEGIFTETGSVYVWDIECLIDAAGVEFPVALTPKQEKAKLAVKALGF